MKPLAAILLLSAATLPAQVPDLAIGRCVRVLGVTAPEDAKKVGFDYVELALQDMLPLSEDDFAKEVARIRSLGLPAISGYGFMPPDVMIVGPNADRLQVTFALRAGLKRAQRLGLSMVVLG